MTNKQFRKLREDAGISRVELARRIGCNLSLIALIETGRRKPGWQNAKLIADVLGVSPEVIRPDIFGSKKTDPKAPEQAA